MNLQEPHTGQALSPRLAYRMLYVEEARLPTLLGRRQLPRGFSSLNPDDDGAVAAALARVETAFEQDDSLGLDSELLALLELVFVRHGGLPRALGVARDNAVCARLRDYLEEHYREAIGLEQLGQLLERHPRHLIAAFRRAYGVPPHTYLLQRRVREAKRRLLGGAPLAELALELGFYDQAHLSVTFKRFTGVSPGAFRRLCLRGT
jgi:AraC-like DNA-binding protein